MIMAMMGSGSDGWRKGPWTSEEDKMLMEHVRLHGEGRWSSVSKSSGLNRNAKSCRLRWVNYLRPGLKRCQITRQEETIIIELHALWGNKWSTIARYLPGRTDNEIKNYWRTHFKKKEKPSNQKPENLKDQIFNQKKWQQQPQQSMINGSIADRKTTDGLETVMPRVEDDQFCPVMSQDHEMVSPWWEFPEEDAVFLQGLWHLDQTNNAHVNHSMNNQAAFGTFSFEKY